ncbi:MAG: hypothetical protein OXF41_09640 [bacterium]|nr:hypothetical protein [bacterium]
MSRPLVDDLAIGTVTAHPEVIHEAAALYRNLFGYVTLYAGRLGEPLARAWSISDPDRRVVLLGAPGEARGLVRFVSGPDPAPAPFSTQGWTALEITVRDVDGLTETVRRHGEFRINGEPVDFGFDGRPPAIRASQVVGPCGEQIYLTQVLAAGTNHVRPPPGCEVGAVFVAVLLCTDPDRQLGPYLHGLGFEAVWKFSTPVEIISREAGLPSDHAFEFTVLSPRGRTRVEVDRFPDDRPLQSHAVGELPPGFGMASFYTEEFDAATDSMRSAGYLAAGPVAAVEAPPYNGGRCAAFTGDLGEIVELIERVGRRAL